MTWSVIPALYYTGRPGKAVSSASGVFKHFFGNHAFFRTFWVKNPVLFTNEAGRRVEDGELRLDKGYVR